MTFAEFVGAIIDFLNSYVVPLIFAIAFLSFLWGIVHYFIIGGHEPAKQEAGRSFLFWGLLGMAVLFSVWGLVNMVLATFFSV